MSGPWLAWTPGRNGVRASRNARVAGAHMAVSGCHDHHARSRLVRRTIKSGRLSLDVGQAGNGNVIDLDGRRCRALVTPIWRVPWRPSVRIPLKDANLNRGTAVCLASAEPPSAERLPPVTDQAPGRCRCHRRWQSTQSRSLYSKSTVMPMAIPVSSARPPLSSMASETGTGGSYIVRSRLGTPSSGSIVWTLTTVPPASM